MSQFLEELEKELVGKRGADPAHSYTAKLLAKGTAKIAQKVGEEAVEVALAAALKDRGNLVKESADLIYHLTLLLVDAGLSWRDVAVELELRKGVSGLVEKAGRQE